MAYTLADIRNRVMVDKLDDPNYTPAVIDRFINDAQRSIANTYELPTFEKLFSGLLPAGEYIFEFPTDYQQAQMLILVDENNTGTDISQHYLPFQDFFSAYPAPENAQSGRPAIWTLHGNRMYLSRPTDQNYTLKLLYLKTPDTLSDGAHVPELPEVFEEVLVLGAYYRVLERNEDFDQASFIKNGDYTDELDKVVARLGKRQTGKPSIMGQPLRHRSYRRI